MILTRTEPTESVARNIAAQDSHVIFHQNNSIISLIAHTVNLTIIILITPSFAPPRDPAALSTGFDAYKKKKKNTRGIMATGMPQQPV